MRSGGSPAGSGRVTRLDPFCLPVRFAASDASADGRVRYVELHRERVVVRRSLAGMRMALAMPVSSFAGVALRAIVGEGGTVIAVVLAHKDPSLALPLFLSQDVDDALAEWRSWARVLGLPLLVEDEGSYREPFTRMGDLQIDALRPRRRRHSALKRRRATMPLRRRTGQITGATPVYRGEREIIARN